MDVSISKNSPAETPNGYNRATELKAFDDSKAGVKGLVDAGVTNIPKIFIRPADELAKELNRGRIHLQVPLIDLGNIEKGDQRVKIVDEIREASEKWGFFQVVNHGIPISVLNDMLDRICMFHEQDVEVKKELYSRDQMEKVRFESNVDLFHSRAANWRDTLTISMLASDHLDPDKVPAVCRDAIIEYIKHVTKLGERLFDLLSEALELKQDHLRALECARGRSFVCHYYPACPEPELTLGTSKHTDPCFLTILLQDQIHGGLQVLHENKWSDVPPIAGGLVVNIGDLLQMVSNDKFVSVDHRVLANHVGPRISMACFFTGQAVPPMPYGPIEELISKENPPLYRDFLVSEYIGLFLSKAVDKSGLDHFKL